MNNGSESQIYAKQAGINWFHGENFFHAFDRTETMSLIILFLLEKRSSRKAPKAPSFQIGSV